MLKANMMQSGAISEPNRHGPVWVKIETEWAYWIDVDSLNFKRVKKHAPVGAIIVVKSRESIDDERTYVRSSFGIVDETGIVELTKKQTCTILARQVLEYMQGTNHWPPFTSRKRVLESRDVEVWYEPTEYDSFALIMTRELIGDDPEMFLARLGKDDTRQHPSWRVETARSGKTKCYSCKDVILKSRFRIGEPIFSEGSIFCRWHHPRCVAKRIDADDVENLDGYKNLNASERLRLKRLLRQ
ncbi:MAG: hypothetical protein JSW61_08305 [Candidatus Thorarchaeota archaeon]|nr:MAG: hypothetical protein JSW61_08305 [Candidatus Thorarchaeota archaeon]